MEVRIDGYNCLRLLRGGCALPEEGGTQFAETVDGAA